MTGPDPALRYRAPRPEDVDTDAIAANLRARLRLVRADGNPEPLFTAVPLRDRTNDPRPYPGHLQPDALARADDINEIQLRALDGLGRLDADVDLAVQRTRVEIAQEVARLRRVHDAFVWSTSIGGTPDPNPDDLWDTLRRETREMFYTAVNRLVRDLYGFWEGPPAYAPPADGGEARRVTLDRFEARRRAEIDVGFLRSVVTAKIHDHSAYLRELAYLRVRWPHCRWPSSRSFRPDELDFEVEASAAYIYRTQAGGTDVPQDGSLPLPGTPFYEWLYGGASDALLRQSFTEPGRLLDVVVRDIQYVRPMLRFENYLDP